MNRLLTLLLALTPLVAYVTMAYSGGDVTTWRDFVAEHLVELVVITAVSAVVYGALANLNSALRAVLEREAVARGEVVEPEWRRLYRRLHNPVPLAKEQDALLNHDYDGIRELDNSLPPWWLYSFYASIAFAVLYLGVFVSSDSALRQLPEYQTEMATAEASVAAFLATQANLVDETNAELLTEVAALARGQETFTTYCNACHATDGGGGVGPNLTDDYWVHGDGQVKAVFATVKHGVPEKGMIAWKNQLSAAEIHEVASYVVTLRGTTPAEPKEPQGNLVAAGGDLTDNAQPSTPAGTPASAEERPLAGGGPAEVPPAPGPGHSKPD